MKTTLREAAEFAKGEPRFWEVFQGINRDGLTKAQFQKVSTRMYYFTFDAYVMGDAQKTREECWNEWVEWIAKNMKVAKPEMLAVRVFTAIDSVHAYT